MAEDGGENTPRNLQDESSLPHLATEGSVAPASALVVEETSEESHTSEPRSEDDGDGTVEMRTTCESNRIEGETSRISLSASLPGPYDLNEDGGGRGVEPSSSNSSLFYTPAHSVVHVDFFKGVTERNSSSRPAVENDDALVQEETQQQESRSTPTTISGPPNVPLPQEEHPVVQPDPANAEGAQPAGIVPPQPTGFRRIVRDVLILLGYGRGNERRRYLVSLLWTCFFCFAQLSAAIALTVYSGFHHSPTDPSKTEWEACDKPLGVWACLGMAKIVCQFAMGIWTFRRRQKGLPTGPERATEEGRQGQQAPSSPGRQLSTTSNRASTLHVGEEDYRESRDDLVKNKYMRASTLMSLINVAWFLTANILLFSSLDTCRFAAPHLWWLIFSLLCLLYLIILEIVLIGIIFFLIWPIFFLAWNIFLIVIGRHPMQRAHYLNPEVEKIPKTVVDQIPLVLYIPPPPGEETSSSTPVVGSMSPTPVMTRSSAPHSKKDHTYPPDQPRRKRRFVFLRRKQTKTNGDGGEKTPSQHKSSPSVEDDKPPERWEDVWETSEYPFVRLDENRATCAICLLDFAAPKTRVAREVIESWAKGNNVQSQAQNEEASKQAEQTPAIEPEVSAEEEGASQMKAAQAQQAEVREESVPVPSNTLDNNADDEEEAQPLRLMPCGHVFHQTCIDPWLTDVSGRCPTCQKPVLPQKKANQR